VPDPSARPTLIPYDTRPVLLNTAEVLQVLEREYPPTLKNAGIEGRVELWIYLSEDGIVEKSEIKTSSGNPLLDEAAGRVIPAMRFSPAMNRDKVTAVWVSQWVTFRVNQLHFSTRQTIPGRQPPGGRRIALSGTHTEGARSRPGGRTGR
jgi:TonB family protein